MKRNTILVNEGRSRTVHTPTDEYAIIAALEREMPGGLHDIAR
jgi:hypothetical protein